MGTLAVAERSEISVLDYAIQRLDQKEFRIRLRSALDEVDLDSCSSQACSSAAGASLMPKRVEVVDRVQVAHSKLLEGFSCTAVVVYLAETKG